MIKSMSLYYPEKKKKLQQMCEYLNEKLEGKADRVPPAYNPENCRLVILAIASGKEPTQEIIRFCRELNKKRAMNVAFIFDAPTEAQNILIRACEEAGTTVIGDVLNVKTGGLFPAPFKAEDRKAADEWFEKIMEKIG